jgi:hypothetical protein
MVTDLGRMCSFNMVMVVKSVKRNIVSIRKFCVIYCIMSVTKETVQSVMLYLVGKCIINIYLLCVVAVHAMKAYRGVAVM